MTEHAPSCNRVRKMWHEHVSRNELLPWTAEGYTHTRVRTNHGTYTTEEPGKHSPMELANLPSTQVRDYINRRDRPYKPFTLADLRPDNPLAEHTWQRKWRAPTWNPNLPVLSTISMEFLYNASPDETQATTSSPPSREPAKTQETRQEKSGKTSCHPARRQKVLPHAHQLTRQTARQAATQAQGSISLCTAKILRSPCSTAKKPTYET